MLVKLITVIIHSLVDLSPWMPPVDGFVKPKLVARSIFFTFYRFHHESVLFVSFKKWFWVRHGRCCVQYVHILYMERSHVENRSLPANSKKKLCRGDQIWGEMPGSESNLR